MVDETNRWNRETRRAPSETKSRLTNEKAFDDKKSTNSCFDWNESTPGSRLLLSAFGSFSGSRLLLSAFGSVSGSRLLLSAFGSVSGSRLLLSAFVSFVGLLISCWNRIKWFTRTWSPAIELRLVNACTWLAKRKSANSTKNFERAGIAFNPFGSIDVQ